MARTRTLTLLRDDIRYQADIEGQLRRHPNAQLNRLINQSINQFRLMVSRVGHPYYLAETAAANTTAGTADYALPADFVWLYGVDLSVGTRTLTLNEYSLQERNDYETQVGVSSGVPVMYRVHTEGYLRFLPTPDSAYSYQLLYLPTSTDLSSDSDTFDGVAGWEDWIVYDVARKILTRDDDDEQLSKVERLLATKEQEIKADCAKRSRSGPARRVDVRGRRHRTEAAARSAIWRI